MEEQRRLSKRERRRLRQEGVLTTGEPTNQLPSKFSLTSFHPTEKQLAVWDDFREGKHLTIGGAAGTGKSYLALRMAYEALDNEEFGHVVIVRSVVPSRDIGFLPGKLEQKVEHYEKPYKSLTAELYGRGDAYEILKKKGVLHFEISSYMRGLTIRNSVVIIDEAQNFTFPELDTVVTRLGEGSRLIVIGDTEQIDLPKGSGYAPFKAIAGHIKGMSTHEFDIEDIVRGGFVREYLKQKYRHQKEWQNHYTR